MQALYIIEGPRNLGRLHVVIGEASDLSRPLSIVFIVKGGEIVNRRERRVQEELIRKSEISADVMERGTAPGSRPSVCPRDSARPSYAAIPSRPFISRR